MSSCVIEMWGEKEKTSVSSPSSHFMDRTVVTPACQPCKNTFLTENKKLQVEKDIYEFVFEFQWH